MKIVFLINTTFPYGSAFSSRALHFTKLFCKLGYCVHVIAHSSSGVDINFYESNVTVDYIDVREDIFYLSGVGTAKPYIDVLKNYLLKNKVDIIVSSSMVHVSSALWKLAKKNGIPYIIEQCEWYDRSIFKGGKLNPYYREHIRQIQKKIKKYDGVIAISRLLQEHYQAQSVHCIRIPTILDVCSIDYRTNVHSNPLNITFAGSLGKGKESIRPIFKSIIALEELASNIHFNIYGANYAQVLENIDNDNGLMKSIAPYVSIHGRIQQGDVAEKLRIADYSIFIRPNRRSSNAGFPTKLAESMAVGTPVITNDTGDIGLYIKSGTNGFMLSDADVQELKEVMKKAISMTTEERKIMREKARKTAEEFFDYRRYSGDVESMLSKHRQ